MVFLTGVGRKVPIAAPGASPAAYQQLERHSRARALCRAYRNSLDLLP